MTRSYPFLSYTLLCFIRALILLLESARKQLSANENWNRDKVVFTSRNMMDLSSSHSCSKMLLESLVLCLLSLFNTCLWDPVLAAAVAGQ